MKKNISIKSYSVLYDRLSRLSKHLNKDLTEILSLSVRRFEDSIIDNMDEAELRSYLDSEE